MLALDLPRELAEQLVARAIPRDDHSCPRMTPATGFAEIPVLGEATLMWHGRPHRPPSWRDWLALLGALALVGGLLAAYPGPW